MIEYKLLGVDIHAFNLVRIITTTRSCSPRVIGKRENGVVCKCYYSNQSSVSVRAVQAAPIIAFRIWITIDSSFLVNKFESVNDTAFFNGKRAVPVTSRLKADDLVDLFPIF